MTKDAIAHAQANNLHKALPIFRKVVAIDPKYPEWHSNLGVTHMRLERYHSAEACFRKALALKADHRDALANLDALKAYLPMSLPHPEPKELKHTVRRMKRIALEELDDPKYAAYREGKKPFLLTGAMESWTDAMSKWSLRYFLERNPDARVDYYPGNMYRESVKPRYTEIDDAYEDFSAAQNSSMYKDKPGVYVQWNLDHDLWYSIIGEGSQGVALPAQFRQDDEWLKECLGSKKLISDYHIATHWRMILIGTQQAGMFSHKDILQTASWQAQVVGSKKWHLCGPSQDDFLYSAGDFDPFDPDYEKWPKALKANCIMDIVKPGEMIFYPRNYWHATEVVESEDGRPSLSITGTITDANNYKFVAHELQRDCSQEANRLPMPERLCNALPKCYDLWEEMWGQKDEEEEKESL